MDWRKMRLNTGMMFIALSLEIESFTIACDSSFVVGRRYWILAKKRKQKHRNEVDMFNDT